MTDRLRLGIFLVAGPVFLGLYCYAVLNLPPWGQYRGPYGDMIARLAVYERHATDTFILFTAAIGVTMLLRREKDVPTAAVGKVADRPPLSEAVRAALSPALLITVIFGFYIGLHGQLTPGGGFQGGVILATASVLVYLADNTEVFKRITSHVAVEVVEAAGASSYALIGVMPILIGLPLLTNILPLGTTGDVFSAGNIALISACVGVEVTAAFLLVIYTYLEEIVTGEIPEE
jgi:multicomponent Na+:H+ antiporter subunit B